MSAVMDPNVAISDAVQTSFNLLRLMRDDGNIPASGYYDRLAQIRVSVSNMRGEAGRQEEASNATQTPRNYALGLQGLTNTADMDGDSGNTTTIPERDMSNQDSMDPIWTGDDFGGMDALNNPFIDNFLAEKGFNWPSGSSPEDDALRAFAHELEDEFLFGSI